MAKTGTAATATTATIKAPSRMRSAINTTASVPGLWRFAGTRVLRLR
jgi:hypothetical protein